MVKNLEGHVVYSPPCIGDLKEVKPYFLAFGSEGLPACRMHCEVPCGHDRPAPSLLVSSVVCLTVRSGLGILVCILDFSCE